MRVLAAFVAAGGVAPLAGLLRRCEPGSVASHRAVSAAAWVACGSPENTGALVASGGVKPVLDHLAAGFAAGRRMTTH